VTADVAAPPLIVLGGPTATGKTDLAVRLALAIAEGGRAAQVISADSRQVYRGMDVGTAKPTLAERRGVVHHGLDLVDPDEAFSVHDFVAHVRPVLASLATRGGVAILAGGTGLWLRAVASGLDLDGSPHDAALRARLEEELALAGTVALAARLRSVAPLLAARTDLANGRRVVRALEIATLRGDGLPPPPAGYPGVVARIVLDVTDRDLHRSWIARRAVAQLDGGLPEEAARLRSRYGDGLRSFTAIGYREAFDLIDGRLDREGYLAVNVARNAAFARRQRTWFRAEPESTWLDPSRVDPFDPALAIARATMAAAEAAGRADDAAGRHVAPGRRGPGGGRDLSFTP
jgi:tRNA dimethylallyltransferase